MWNSNKSLKLSAMFTKVVMFLVVAFAIALPIIIKYTGLSQEFTPGSKGLTFAIPVYYICCVLALIALFSLERLLTNISKEIIFVEENVKKLRRISWCCLLAALALLMGSIASLMFLLLSMMAGFIGLILRVVKNVFEAAVELKDENDFTI